eukprot:gene7356-8138_t
MSFTWEPSLLSELNTLARKHCFDWGEVSKEVNALLLRQGEDVLVTADHCRIQFAACNPVVMPSRAVHDGKEEGVDAGAPAPTEDLSSMTLDQLVGHVEALEEKMKKRKEIIFQRVLDSLGGPLSPSEAILSEEARFLIQDSQERKLRHAAAERQRQADEQERKKLLEERERLKKRFEPDSVDAVGENPLGDSLTSSSFEWSRGNDNVVVEVMMAQPVLLDSALEGSDFDILLSELEKELDARAVEKEEASDNELREVLSILDAAANNKQWQKKHETSSSASVQSLAISRSKTNSLEEALPQEQQDKPLPTPPSGARKERETNGETWAATNLSPPPPPAPQTAAAVSSKRPMGPTTASRSPAQKKDAQTRETSEKEDEEEEEEEEGGEDDDDNLAWRSKRSQFKKSHAGVIVEQGTSLPVYSLPTAAARRQQYLAAEYDRPVSEETEEEEEEEEEEEDDVDEQRSEDSESRLTVRFLDQTDNDKHQSVLPLDKDGGDKYPSFSLTGSLTATDPVLADETSPPNDAELDSISSDNVREQDSRSEMPIPSSGPSSIVSGSLAAHGGGTSSIGKKTAKQIMAMTRKSRPAGLHKQEDETLAANVTSSVAAKGNR